MNGRRAKRLHRLAADLQEAGLRPPRKARRLDRWLQPYTPGRPRQAVPTSAQPRHRGGRPLPPMPREASTLPGRGPAKVGRPGPAWMAGRVRRDALLSGARAARQQARAAWRNRQRRRRDRRQDQAA